jgi:hypothetical protein
MSRAEASSRACITKMYSLLSVPSAKIDEALTIVMYVLVAPGLNCQLTNLIHRTPLLHFPSAAATVFIPQKYTARTHTHTHTQLMTLSHDGVKIICTQSFIRLYYNQ